MLQGKTAIVTGAGSGIGRAIALAYARAGARVVVSDLVPEGGQETVAQVRAAGGQAIFQAADVSRFEDNQALVKAAVDTYGALHVACNNAGIGGAQAPTAITRSTPGSRSSA